MHTARADSEQARLLMAASGSEILEAHSKQLNWLAQEEDIVTTPASNRRAPPRPACGRIPAPILPLPLLVLFARCRRVAAGASRAGGER